MTIKLVAIDIDGTLLDNNHLISVKVKDAIQKTVECGVKVVLCTGRPLPGAKKYVEELALTNKEDYLITYNGSLIQNVNSGKVIAKHGITLDDYAEAEFLARKNDVHMHVIDNQFIYTPNRDIGKYTILEAYLVDMPVKYRTPEEMDETMDLIKIMMIDDPELLSAAIKKLPQSFKERFTTVRSTDFYFEIINKNASKGNALKQLAQHLGISQDETMAIGDNENDLSMIEYAKIGIAMGNATEQVKKTAQAVVSSNDQAGVAEALEKFVLSDGSYIPQ